MADYKSTHRETFITFIQANADASARAPGGYAGTTHHEYGLRVPAMRDFIKTWHAEHKDLPYNDWIALLDDLYHGESMEERHFAAFLLDRYKSHRAKLPLSQLEMWLGQLVGWAEVDATCQGVYTAREMLGDWDAWSGFLRGLSTDDNMNKRRASLVLLTMPVRKSDDMRLYDLGIENIERLKLERDKLITKAVSWLLRSMLKHHRDASAKYVADNADTLPAIAVREYRKKYDTGKK